MTKCKVCRTEFQRRSISHKTCSTDCALVYVAEQNTKKLRKKQIADRRDTKLKLDKLKTRSDYIKETQIAFNAYIRERDKNQLCICCDEPLCLDAVGGGYDCGHYRSVGSAPHLRFNENNAHGQRKKCNRYGAGRAVDYRIHLIKRKGLEVVEALEADNSPMKWTIPELIEMKKKFQQMKKELESER